MVFAKVPSPFRALGEESIEMGSAAIHAESISGFGFRLHRFWIAWIADRNLTGVPWKFRYTQCFVNEINSFSGEFRSPLHGTYCVVFQDIHACEPRSSATEPARVFCGLYCLTGGGKRLAYPFGQCRIVWKVAPAVFEERPSHSSPFF